ncbi:MFS transporter [Ensifer sp. MPMI2T]|nr:MFS transporter [Ensifer sp. MPMI2T]
MSNSISLAMADDARQSHQHTARRVAIAGLVGTAIEWYDFYIYGLAAALVFGHLFFPEFSSVAGTLAAFGTFAVGFVARPLGGVIFGHFGDRIGRKGTLIVTLFLMGAATVVIGLLPTYETIGVAAPILLVTLRFLQGFAVGGEWGGAVTMVIETAPEGRRGLYGSLPQMGVPLGLIFSSSIYSIISQLPDDMFRSWGWRVPFLLSILLIVIGLFIRSRISETAAFKELKEGGARPQLPIKRCFQTSWRQILLAIGLYVSAGVPFYIVTVFVLSYATSNLGIGRSTMFTGLLVGAVMEAFTVPLFGALSDRFGRRPVFIFFAVVALAFAFPFFWLLGTGDTAVVFLALVIALAVVHAGMYGPTASLYAEMFPPSVRYTGTSVGYQMGGVVAGFVPMLAGFAVNGADGASWPISLIWAACAAIGLLSALLVRETQGVDLNHEPASS